MPKIRRFIAYGEDIGERDSLLPDSDGEDEPAAACKYDPNKKQLEKTVFMIII